MKSRIDELAGLMDEFSLSEASLNGDGWKVSFKRPQKRSKSTGEDISESEEMYMPMTVSAAVQAPVEQKPTGMPVSSPMNGIFYSSPSPSSPPFVKPGESVTAGQVVALIEAMKVFNEIVAPVSGIVDRIVVESGALVQPGEALLYIS